MNRLLLPGQSAQAPEDRVDVTDSCIEIEDRVEIDARRDLRIGGEELPEVLVVVPRLHRVSLDEPVRVVARETGLDERDQETVAEHETVARIDVPPHSLRMNDKAFDDPREPIEHVVEREERIRNDDALSRGVRDVALVPHRDVLEADERGRPYDTREDADSLPNLRITFVRH